MLVVRPFILRWSVTILRLFAPVVISTLGVRRLFPLIENVIKKSFSDSIIKKETIYPC